MGLYLYYLIQQYQMERESNRPCPPNNKLPPTTLTNAKSTGDLTSDPSRSLISGSARNFQKYQVIVESQQLQAELKNIEWRCKTDFPVVKVLFYKLLQRKLLGECAVVQVAIQAFPQNLASLTPLSLPHTLYLLKEALVGFERLIDRFGSFDPSARMILLSRHGKCRVWINENITLNFPSRRTKLSQAAFLTKLSAIFQQKTIKTPAAYDFFLRLNSSERFLQALHTLESFTRNNKIVLPGKLVMNGQGSPPVKNADKTQQSDPIKEKYKEKDDLIACGSLKKIPKFILQLRQERKQEQAQSKSFDSPKKTLPKDRSCAKTTKQKPKQIDLTSQGKSSHSPLSRVSHTKSNNTGKQGNDSLRPAVRQLLKQNSQNVINTYATMVPISTPLQSHTEKHISSYNNPKKTQKDLTLIRVRERTPKKQRKMSNEESPSKLSYISNNQPIAIKIPPVEQCSVLCSQQTAATIDEVTINNTPPPLLKLIKQPTSPSPSPSPSSLKENCIYQKNGWLKRVNTLTGDSLRDTMQSQYQGQQTFSYDYLLTGQQLGALGSMGKQLKGSIMHETPD